MENHASNDSIARICTFPETFRAGNKSPLALAKDLNLREVLPSIRMAALQTYLATHPELIEKWVIWSEDKRVREGWYLKIETGVNEVGYFHYERGYSSVRRFTSPSEAVANFILNDLGDIIS